MLLAISPVGGDETLFHTSLYEAIKDVRQGCVMSPYLFNILSEMAMREAMEGYDGGSSIAGRKLSNL